MVREWVSGEIKNKLTRLLEKRFARFEYTQSVNFLHIMREWKSSRRRIKENTKFTFKFSMELWKKCFVVQSSSLQRRCGLFFSFCCSVEKIMTAWHEELIRVVGLLDDDFRVGFAGCFSWVPNWILRLIGWLVLRAGRMIREFLIEFEIQWKQVRNSNFPSQAPCLLVFTFTKAASHRHESKLKQFLNRWLNGDSLQYRAYNICARKERKRKLNNRNL